MTAKMVMVCPACQDNKHGACQGMGCVCALRQHPEIKPLDNQVAKFRAPEE